MRRPLLACVAMLALGGCFPQPTADEARRSRMADFDLEIISDPPGARCVLERDGARVAEVASAPGMMAVPRSGSEATVRCTAPGRLETAIVLAPTPDPARAAIGMALLGIPGIVAAGATGAGLWYASPATVHLPPEAFATADERDVWFNARLAAVSAENARRIVTERGYCNLGDPAGQSLCESAMARIRADGARDIAMVERQRQRATIAGR